MKLLLHIGIEKTGTTSIQAALQADRAALASQGILYPKLFGNPNHMEIAVAATEDNPNSELHIFELSREQCTHAEYRDRLRAALHAERTSGTYDKILVSNEHCHSRLPTIDSIAYLLTLFEVSPGDCEIFVYLRRQDKLAISLYSTVLKLGDVKDIFPDMSSPDLPYYYDFEKILENYSHVFGAERISVRIYEPSQLVGGDAVTDFYHTARLGIEPSLIPRENASISLAQALFLQKFNQYFPVIFNGKVSELRGPIFDVIKDTCLGDPFLPSRAEAEGFYSAFEDGNRRILRTFLPNSERYALFDEDFSTYPAYLPRKTLTEDEWFAFVEAIWRKRNG